MPRLSVIIPTHLRAPVLERCLRCLAGQTVAADIEVIVVSDAKDEKTAALFGNSAWPMRVKYLEVEPCQQGVARNAGTALASAETVMFIGDDIFLDAEACERHLAAHGRVAVGGERVAVLGFTTWDPACGITPVMTWLEMSGWQFGYPMISPYAHGLLPVSIQHKYSYTSHISLPLDIAKKHPFRTDVHLYGWEDIEWGTRLRNAGVRLCYEPRAHALHHHHIDLADSLKRMETLGRSAVLIAEKVPEFDRVPHGLKLFAYRLFALFPTMAGRHRKAFLHGLTTKSGMVI